MSSVVHLVLRDDQPAGVVVGTRDNWTGMAFGFSLPDMERVRSELNVAGVYVLVGVEESSRDDEFVAYIGEAESLSERLKPPHAQLIRQDVSWNRVIVFLSQAADLHKAHVKWLESRLIARARAASRLRLINGPSPAAPRLPEHDQVFVESFFENMLALYPLLGVDAFDLPDARPRASSDPVPRATTEPVQAVGDLEMRRNGQVVAHARVTRGGFTLLRGSHVSRRGTGSEGQNVIRKRDLLLANGKLVPVDADWCELMDDHELNSSSAAAKLVAGASVSGMKEWRTAQGQTLGDLSSTSAVAAFTPAAELNTPS